MLELVQRRQTMQHLTQMRPSLPSNLDLLQRITTTSMYNFPPKHQLEFIAHELCMQPLNQNA